MYSSTGPVSTQQQKHLIHLEHHNSVFHKSEESGSISLTVSGGAPSRQLPEDEAEGVHVDTQEGVALEVDGALQDLRSHVAPRPHLQVQRSASGRENQA